jgi:hypothetical protein
LLQFLEIVIGRMAHPPFNPLDKSNLGLSVAQALLARPVGPLPPPERFIGAGIYSIYYFGGLGCYESIARHNRDNKFGQPIYVGKAVPPGARKGGFGLGTMPGTALFDRLREHAKSIEQADNLDIQSFACRYLISDDIWIPLGESLTIERFRPVWNVLIDGFGNHAPGGGRQQQVKPRWDTIHPGRPWAQNLPANPQTEDQLLQLLHDFLAGGNVPTIPTDIAVIEE